jgi:hypothetical protein
MTAQSHLEKRPPRKQIDKLCLGMSVCLARRACLSLSQLDVQAVLDGQRDAHFVRHLRLRTVERELNQQMDNNIQRGRGQQ